MSKPVRFVLACVVFLLTISISASAAAPARAQQNTSSAHLQVYWAPEEEICVGDKAPVGLFYYRESISSPGPNPVLAPLGGTLITTVTKGSVDKPSLSVHDGPGIARLTYTATTSGDEVLASTLTYGSDSVGVTVPIKVEDCDYLLSINANEAKQQEGTTVTSWYEAKGIIRVSSSNVTGSIPATAGFGLTTNNEELTCDMDPDPTSKSTVVVSGSVTWDYFDTKTIHLQISYQPLKFPATNEVCKDKFGEVKIKKIFLQSDTQFEPGDYLKFKLDFTGGNHNLSGPFGEGSAFYLLEPKNASSSGNGQ
jgi:hypothetical protein